MKSVLPLLAVLLIITAGCGGARPYRAMARAATSEENVFAQAQDKELRIQLREALLARGDSPLAITPYVYMERGFVVGFVADGAQRDGVLSAAQGVQGLRSLQGYLPDRPTTSSTTDDVATKAIVKAALVPHPEIGVTHVDIEVLDGHVVLLGVVGSEEARESAVAAAAGVGGVKGVTNFPLLPEPGYESLRPHLR
jgi:osmotically-inducible protein OsmY